MLHGGELLAWARREATAWWDARHDPQREKLDELIARAYLRGGIDALKEETARILREHGHQSKGAPREAGREAYRQG